MNTLLAVIILLLGMQSCAGTRPAQAQERIGFVRLLVTEDAVTVLESGAEPGRLKRPRGEGRRQAVAFDVLLGGEVVWRGGMDAPLRQRLEYVDDEGRLQTQFVQREEAEVTLRFPVTQARYRLRLYRSGAAQGKAAGGSEWAPVAVTFD